MRPLPALSLLSSLLLLACTGVDASQLLRNVTVHTMDPAQPRAEAMVWDDDGRILAVGTADELAARFADAASIDGGGQVVLPGLIDAHAHLLGLGSALLNADLAGARSKQEVLQRLTAFAAELPADAWLIGRGWDQNRWPEREFPTRADLDGAFPERPVWLARVDGHAGWANSAALRAVPRSLDGDWQPEGGRILREDGVASGVLIDTAMDLIDAVVPPPNAATRELALRRALAEAVRHGLTGVHDMGVSLDDLALMRRLADSGALPLRITAYADGDAAALTALCAFGPLQHAGGRLRMAGVKLYADGALGSRGAALLADYHDEPGHRGLLVTAPADLDTAMRKARGCGLQVAAHAIGDAANRSLLELFAGVLGDDRAQRWRIEHAQVVAVDDIPRFAQLGVLASMQPTHATSDMPWAGDRLGSQRLAGAYAWRRFSDAGVRMPFGSDFPVEAVDPMLGLHAAITRQDADGNPPGGWLPDQRLSLQEAVHGFTVEAAYAGFAESEVGRLAPGLRADFIMLGSDPFELGAERLRTLQVRSTWVDGAMVYRAP
jgi:predicted amidohydrolase YtcJ